MTKFEFLVRGVLKAYGIENAQTEILRHLSNMVVRVQTDHLQYALRICTPEVTAQRLTEELEWLRAIQRDTDSIVPTPVANARVTAGWIHNSHKGLESMGRLAVAGSLFGANQQTSFGTKPIEIDARVALAFFAGGVWALLVMLVESLLRRHQESTDEPSLHQA